MTTSGGGTSTCGAGASTAAIPDGSPCAGGGASLASRSRCETMAIRRFVIVLALPELGAAAMLHRNVVQRQHLGPLLRQIDARVPVRTVRHWHRRGHLAAEQMVGRLAYFSFEQVRIAQRLAELVAAAAERGAEVVVISGKDKGRRGSVLRVYDGADVLIRVIDVALGGLNYQIEHHLFPSMPRPHLRYAQPIVRGYCREQGLPYVETGLTASYAEALRHLTSGTVDGIMIPGGARVAAVVEP